MVFIPIAAYIHICVYSHTKLQLLSQTWKQENPFPLSLRLLHHNIISQEMGSQTLNGCWSKQELVYDIEEPLHFSNQMPSVDLR